MKIFTFYLLIVIVLFMQESYSQEMIIKSGSGEESSYNISDIDSLTFLREESYAEIGSPSVIAFPIINCLVSESDTSFSITNIGGKELQITHIKIQPLGDFEFINEPQHVMGLLPGESYELGVRFQPETSGLKEAEVIVTCNARSGVYYKIPLTGTMELSDFSLSEDIIDLGTVCPNSLEKIAIEVENTGNGSNTIDLTHSKFIQPGKNQIQLEEGAKTNIEVDINIGTEEGPGTGSIVFTDMCGNVKEVLINFFVVQPKLEAEGLELDADLYSSENGNITIRNIAQGDVTISDINTGSDQFTFDSPDIPFVIPFAGSVEIPVTFSPTEKKSPSSTMKIKSTCGYEMRLQLKGNTRVSLVSDDFEWYNTGSFPYSGGWSLLQYGVNLDSLQHIVDTVSVSGNKSLKGFANWGTDHSTTYYATIPISEKPEVIYAECWSMIGTIGFAGVGLMSDDQNATSCFASVIYSNHAHFFYALGYSGSAKDGRWPDDAYQPMQWYKIKISYNFEKKQMSVWEGDEFKVTDTNLTIGDIENLYFYLYTSGGYGSYGDAFYDDVKVWYIAE